MTIQGEVHTFETQSEFQAITEKKLFKNYLLRKLIIFTYHPSLLLCFIQECK